ncbi:MAG TPA: phosphatase PAP2 family protein [Fimbriimonadaceae bacterium]|nr:phosphatase PAP2 family protein [Fimbriimonadaceae bacterium]
MHGLDVSLFHWINDWSVQWKGLYVFFSEATKGTPVRIGIVVILALLIAAGPTTRKAALIGVFAILMSNSLADGLKHAIHMLRPCVELQSMTLRVGMLDSYGTASSHAANMAALAFVLCYYFKWWGTPWILVAILTGLSRVYVGVHYPSQVLLGYICGVLCAFLVIKTWEAFLRVRANKHERNEQRES